MFIPVILTKSERRRSEGAWKLSRLAGVRARRRNPERSRGSPSAPEDFSLSILDQGVLTPRPLLGTFHHHRFLILSLFSHAADAQMRRIQIRHKCQSMSFTHAVKPLKKIKILAAAGRRVAQRSDKIEAASERSDKKKQQ
jgi:hypothetical protein